MSENLDYHQEFATPDFFTDMVVFDRDPKW